MAAADVMAMPVMPMPSYKPIIDRTVGSHQNNNIKFDPKEHLAFEPPSQVVMMKDIGYSETAGVSPVAVSQPFRLFSTKAIQRFRDEVLSPDVMSECLYRSNLAACQIRGYAPKHAPFIYDAWRDPETLAIISKIAGIDLVPCMNFEIGHINIAVKSDKETKEELDAIEHERTENAEDKDTAGSSLDHEKPVVGWHTDSYPFVVVTMLSCCKNMIGGETMLRTGNGGTMKVRGPEMGCAVVLQGRYISHQALRALGAKERITMVTSFRPKDPHLRDDSVLTTVRGISNLSELYYDFCKYRLEIMEERIRTQLKSLREANAGAKRIETKALKTFLSEQEHFLSHTNKEIVPDELVIPESLPELNDTVN
nr:hypothetical protein CFP56_04388 [Quercus suber]